MGETRVKFRVYSGELFAELEGLVDTGATFTKIPRSTASKIGLQARYEAEVMLGDGKTLTRSLALGEVEIENVKRPVLIAIGEMKKYHNWIHNTRSLRIQSKPGDWKA